MRTICIIGLFLTCLLFIWNGEAFCFNKVKTASNGTQIADGNDAYSPAGKWLIKTSSEDSPDQVKLFVPDFISYGHSKLLEINSGMGQYNETLVYSNFRRNLYKDLFTEIMLMTTSTYHQFEYELSKPLNAGIKSVNYEIEMLGEIKVIPKSSRLFKDLSTQLELVGLIFTVQDKVNEAGAEAATIYTSLLAFRNFRYQILKAQIQKITNYDPEMLVGLDMAYSELMGMQKKDLATLKNKLETKKGTEEASKGLIQMAMGSQFAKLISAMAGGGLLGVSLATAVPTAWFWQLGRTYDAKKAEASVVLLSTIDRNLFENINMSDSPADNYSVMQMRSHLSFMICNAAKVYENKNSVQSNFEQPMRNWIRGFPYYDFANLALMKQKAIDDIEILSPVKEQTTTKNGSTFTDPRDGHLYKTAKIGNQVWMAENLKTTKLNNGTAIPLVLDNTAWCNLSTPGYCWYNHDATNKSTYGALYNWYTVNTGKLCPTGWHVPDFVEWNTLTTYLGGAFLAGDKLKETGTTHWVSSNGGATNEKGFTALPGGYRDYVGAFGNIGSGGCWWSSFENSTQEAWKWNMYFNSSSASSSFTNKHNGFSIRCLRD